jgi:hypothetical protein
VVNGWRMDRVGWHPRALFLGVLFACSLVAVSAAGARVGGSAGASRATATPNAPAPYQVPGGAVRVSSSAQLVRALASSHTTSIALADGVYDHGEPFYDQHGHRLYAAHLGKAVLRAGIVLGAHRGGSFPVLRGLRFDVRSLAKTLYGGIVHVWGSASSAHILDTRLRGHGIVDAGVVVRQPEGFVARRVVASGFRSYGVLVDPDDPEYRARRPFLLEDVAVTRVARPHRGSSNGTAEACFWLGSTGVVRRASARRCGLVGVWTGSANTGSLLEDVTIDRAGVGVYLEHFTTNSTFRRLRVGPHVSRGVNAEWADPAWGAKPASVDNIFQDSDFDTSLVGVYLDAGTTRTSVLRSTFTGQSWAGIGNFLGVDNRFEGNAFKRLQPGAVPISPGHL